MSHERNLEYLNKHRIVYRRMPISDKPTQENECYMFYEDGTHECYELFRSKAKITTYKSLKWHLLIIWYLNPQLDQNKFEDVAYVIANKDHGFITFTIPNQLLKQIIYEVSMCDLEEPPKNRLRKVIFKQISPLSKEEKLRVVGELIGRSKRIHKDDIYDAMLCISDKNFDTAEKITISGIAKLLSCSTRTIYRNMCTDLKREKELLNQQL